ncbi:Lipoxygenase plant protein [Dioscorea alata]|uniref:Lipoxygenase plant protein n=1 Tax=Dioscorea alata TaxID=55571 RepID=A0ACB7W9S4_DIOAL|nr:Lipoxygenase plant protein [Dioscorea alata]
MLHSSFQISNQAPSFFSFSRNYSSSSSTFLYGTSHAIINNKVRAHHEKEKSSGRKGRRTGRICCSVSKETKTAVEDQLDSSPVMVKGVVNVLMSTGDNLTNIGITRPFDDIQDLLGKSLLVEIFSSHLDPQTGKEKGVIAAYAHRQSKEGDIVKYECSFAMPKNFGIGGVLVTNEHHKETFLRDIVLFPLDDSKPVNISCMSWVHSKFDCPEKRIFFTNKSYLPFQTPAGIQRLREADLEIKRGDGTGERKTYERIYDYDTYNDLGDPDNSDDLVRPILGGSKEFPYPRRCRTGRSRTKKDPNSETRTGTMYVPRDEAFSEVKQLTFSVRTLRSALKALVPSIETAIIDTKLGFPYFTAIDSLFDEGMPLPKQEGLGFFRTLVPRLIKAIQDTTDILLFETPEMIDRDKFSWFRDEELGRQTLAGLNPLGIQLVTEFPFVSKLDPEVYGPPESAITKELIECELGGRLTVEEAIKQKRLFIVDYHDLLLPYVHKVRALENTTLYGSRTLFFFTRKNTLKPIAIELTRPASPTKPQWKQVFSPHNWDATDAWLWKLAKIHAGAHDSGVHQLVSHWLRTHACTETYVIAANRQLSAMHPIYRLLHPHFRYTMEINALAREFLISGGGIIETSFSPGKYSMELCSVAYDKLWRFDTQSLPGDLISRGMAVEDPNAEHGLKLTIEDYPYAADGLLVWSSIKEWVTDYVCHYYPRPELVKKDQELQAWWTEVRVKGHPEKKDEPWWPKLETEEDLIGILCTIIWVASGHHAAVNFGQYHYAGYFPNRPTIARVRMPVEALEDGDSEEFEKFWEKPETALMKCFPSQIQATVVMSILDILSSHAPDEEYLGGESEASWAENLEIKAAFERFNGRMKVIEGIVDARNANHELRNRCGAGIVPYELLKPFSEPGVTGMGIPNSISI